MKTLAVSPSVVESSTRRQFFRRTLQVAGVAKLAMLGGTGYLHRQAIGQALGLLPAEPLGPIAVAFARMETAEHEADDYHARYYSFDDSEPTPHVLSVEMQGRSLDRIANDLRDEVVNLIVGSAGLKKLPTFDECALSHRPIVAVREQGRLFILVARQGDRLWPIVVDLTA